MKKLKQILPIKGTLLNKNILGKQKTLYNPELRKHINTSKVVHKFLSKSDLKQSNQT